MKRTLPLFLLAMLAFSSTSLGADVPENVEYIDGKHVFIKAPKWHKKEAGAWLFTCRLEVSAVRLVKPVAHLRFFHTVVNEEGEEKTDWEKKAIVRRNQFNRSTGGRKESFVRVFIDDLPEGLDALTVEFRNQPPSKE